MKLGKTFLIVLAVFAAFSSTTCFASEKTHRAAIEEMLTLTDVDKLMDSMFVQLEGMLKSQYAQMDVSEADRPIFEKYNARLMALMKEEMGWAKMKEDFINIYMRVFTEEEINEINKFYKSEVGQKMIAKMPALMQETMALSQNNLKRIMPEIKRITREMALEIRNNHAAQNDDGSGQ